MFFFIILFLVPELKEEKTLFIVISLTILFNTIGMEWLYKALEQYSYITVRSIVFKFLALLAMFLLVHEKDDYVIYGGITIFASSASSIFNFINIHKFIELKPIGNYHLKKHLKAVFIFFAMSCATTIYTHLDSVMLGFMRTNEDVGYYNAAIKIKTILVSIVTSLGVVLLPRASYYIENNLKTDFFRITKKALNFVFLISFPLLLYFILFAKEGILFLSGNAYEEAIIPMQILMPTLLFIGLTNIMGIQMLIPLGKENIVLYSEIAGAIVDLIINFLLIPKFSSTGAAIGTLIAEIIVWIVQYYFLKDLVYEGYKQINYLHIIVSLMSATCSSIWVKLLNYGNFLTLVLSATLFFTIYISCLLMFKEPFLIEFVNQLKIKFSRICDNK